MSAVAPPSDYREIVGFNPRNWPHNTKETFDAQIFRSENPDDTHPDLPVDLLYAEYGGRDAYIAKQIAYADELEKAERDIEDATKNGQPPPADALAVQERIPYGIINVPGDDGEARMKYLQDNIPDSPGYYVFAKPWRPGGDNAYGKGGKVKLGTYLSFGRKNIDPRVDGKLVVEVTMFGVNVLKNDELVPMPDGMLIDRFMIERKRSDVGGFEHEYEIPVWKKTLFDLIMSFAVAGDDRKRTLIIDYFAPDEKTDEWIPIYTAGFGVDYRYISLELEEKFHSPAYMGTAPDSPSLSAEDEKTAQERRQAQVMANLKEGLVTAIITQLPEREARIIRPPDNIGAEKLAERAAFMAATESKKRSAAKADIAATLANGVTNMQLHEELRRQLHESEMRE